ncbi:hypothetical protein ERY430_41056 [Erythrobacter sp. EC-HK427]|nr:hypothetical protein ERY430_41056 [Erythrobacter sp. EC-HK427]
MTFPVVNAVEPIMQRVSGRYQA